MPSVNRVLDPHPIETLDAYLEIGGGNGLDAARRLAGVGIADEVNASGLRGRGGAGFPTGVKWESVAAAAAAGTPPIVVVNGAEGEPGSFKDRTLLRRNPYRVVEGALIAAEAVHAQHVVVGLKQSFVEERRRVAYAIAEMCDAGWLDDVDVHVAVGPSDYLFGEETALLEVIEGRQPFPRIAPPYRRGLADGDTEVDADRAIDNEAPASGLVLANNVETFANVPGIVVRGADWFRTLGTTESPGTVVCTVSGDTKRAGVAEFPMGTTVGEIIDEIGGGPREGRRIVATISGVANAILPVELFATAACYEELKAVGSGLGAAGFIVFDDSTDLVSVAAAISRFLAVESCGQCEPCKRDGLAIATDLDELSRSDTDAHVAGRVRDHLGTIADGARCFLATQHQLVAASVLDLYPHLVEGHLDGSLAAAEAYAVAPIAAIDDGLVILDPSQARKQPDWSYDYVDSGRWPAAYLGDTPVDVRTSRTRPARPQPSAQDDSAPTGAAGSPDEGTDGADVLDAERRPLPIDVGDQLDLAHHDLVEALLDTALAKHDDEARRAAVDEFAEQLDRHVEITTHVLLPWVRRVGGDAGERAAGQAEELQRSAEQLVASRRDDSSDRQLRVLAD
ncbi:MAG: NADH-ubiquinone oxidoreductase-F iron-sulfur binding region domain-containing protein, partial [Ilumatobacteraceae bacterium]